MLSNCDRWVGTVARPASLSSLRDCDHLVINWIKHHGHPDFRPPLSPCSEHTESDLVPQLPSLAPSTVRRCRHAVWVRAELARVKKVDRCEFDFWKATVDRTI